MSHLLNTEIGHGDATAIMCSCGLGLASLFPAHSQLAIRLIVSRCVFRLAIAVLLCHILATRPEHQMPA